MSLQALDSKISACTSFSQVLAHSWAFLRALCFPEALCCWHCCFALTFGTSWQPGSRPPFSGHIQDPVSSSSVDSMSLGDRDCLFSCMRRSCPSPSARVKGTVPEGSDGSITYASVMPSAPVCDCSSPQLQNCRQGAEPKFGNNLIITLKYALGVPTLETWPWPLEKQALGSGVGAELLLTSETQCSSGLYLLAKGDGRWGRANGVC